MPKLRRILQSLTLALFWLAGLRGRRADGAEQGVREGFLYHRFHRPQCRRCAAISSDPLHPTQRQRPDWPSGIHGHVSAALRA